MQNTFLSINKLKKRDFSSTVLRYYMSPQILRQNRKSPKGGVNRRRLKFTNFKYNYKPELALEIKPSPKERVKIKSRQMERMTR
jgi:hypothetical protein